MINSCHKTVDIGMGAIIESRLDIDEDDKSVRYFVLRFFQGVDCCGVTEITINLPQSQELYKLAENIRKIADYLQVLEDVDT